MLANRGSGEGIPDGDAAGIGSTHAGSGGWLDASWLEGGAGLMSRGVG